jgi:hypothetical protein
MTKDDGRTTMDFVGRLSGIFDHIINTSGKQNRPRRLGLLIAFRLILRTVG